MLEAEEDLASRRRARVEFRHPRPGVAEGQLDARPTVLLGVRRVLLVLRAGPVGIIRNLDDRLVDGEVELSVADSLITILISNNVKCGPRTKEGPVNLAVAVTIVAIIITPVVCDALWTIAGPRPILASNRRTQRLGRLEPTFPSS